MNEQTIGLVRYALLFIGSWVTQAGVTSNDEWTTISGALIALLTVGWSVWTKWGQTKVPTDSLTASQKVEVKQTPVLAK